MLRDHLPSGQTPPGKHTVRLGSQGPTAPLERRGDTKQCYNPVGMSTSASQPAQSQQLETSVKPSPQGLHPIICLTQEKEMGKSDQGNPSCGKGKRIILLYVTSPHTHSKIAGKGRDWQGWNRSAGLHGVPGIAPLWKWWGPESWHRRSDGNCGDEWGEKQIMASAAGAVPRPASLRTTWEPTGGFALPPGCQRRHQGRPQVLVGHQVLDCPVGGESLGEGNSLSMHNAALLQRSVGPQRQSQTCPKQCRQVRGPPAQVTLNVH